LGDWFDKLEQTLQKYQIQAKNIWNADEVGVQISDMSLKFLTTRKTVRRNLSNQHITVLITTNSVGAQVPPYLLFPGENLSAVPASILEKPEEVLANFSQNGWMDSDHFKAWSLWFIDQKKKLLGPSDDFTLLLVDGHSSRFDPDTMFNLACNQVIVLVGPSNLTNAWQPNDQGTNRTFKSLL